MFRRFTVAMLLAAVMMMAAGCSRSEGPDPAPVPEKVRTVNLHISVALPGMTGTRAEYTEGAADENEMLHSVRIIIVSGSDGKVEHNTLWDLSASPAILAEGESFPVKANDKKTILFIGNEASGKVTDTRTGETVGTGAYFTRFIPAAAGAMGYLQEEDLAAIRENLVIDLDENLANGGRGGRLLATPLQANSIYEGFEVGSTDISYRFRMHRAATKFYFELTNESRTRKMVNTIHLKDMATREKYFFDADFTDNEQNFSDYTPISESQADVASYLVCPCGYVDPNKTVRFGPFYLPEGLKKDVPYSIAIQVDGVTGDYVSLGESKEKPGGQIYVPPMTDLPRNTCVIIKGSFKRSDPSEMTFKYTVCPWDEYTIDIPEYN